MGKQIGNPIEWKCAGCESYTMNCLGHKMRAINNSVSDTVIFEEALSESDGWNYVDSFPDARWDAMLKAYEELK